MELLHEIPRVHGQHRDRPLAAERRARAVDLHRAGLTYQQVADEMGYAHRGTVYRIIKTALETHVVESIDELRALDVDRLDALQAALWSRASGGDPAAVAAVCRIIHDRCQLLGLYVPQQPASPPVGDHVSRPSGRLWCWPPRVAEGFQNQRSTPA